MAGRDELRPVGEEALHVTLAFLGWTPEERTAAAWEAATDAVEGHGPPRLSPAGVKAVPPRRPRLIALDLADEGGRAAALHEAVATVLSGAGLYEDERRPFWAHVTLVRARRGVRMRPLAAEPPRIAPFAAGTMTLYRSHLSPGGARYKALERLRLRS